MPDLPKVSQDFIADATRYIAGIEEMLAANRDLIDSIGEVQSAIDGLHGKEVDITFNEDEVTEQLAAIKEQIDEVAQDKTVTIFVKYVSEGKPDDVIGATSAIEANATLGDSAGETASRLASEAAAADALSKTLSDTAKAKIGTADANRLLADTAEATRVSIGEEDENAARLMESMRDLIGETGDASGAGERLFAVTRDGSAAMMDAATATDELTAARVADLEAARNLADEIIATSNQIDAIVGDNAQAQVDASQRIVNGYNNIRNAYRAMQDIQTSAGAAAGLEAEAAQANAAAEDYARGAESIQAMRDALIGMERDAGGATPQINALQSAVNALDRSSIENADVAGPAISDAITSLRDNARTAGPALDAASQALYDLARAEGYGTASSNTALSAARALTPATRDLGNAAADSIPSWFSWTRQLQTFGGLLTTILGREVPLVTSIAAWHLVLDSAAEGIIAVSGALIALGAAAAGMAPSFLDIYNHLTATRDQIEAFGVEIKPFTSWFLDLQHAMQTDSIELYGEALLDLGKANGSLMTSIENVGQAIDRMGAKISEWVGSNTNFAQTISKGAGYAKQLGDALGELIEIIDHLITADSGIVHYVLDFVDAFLAAINAVLGFSEGLDKLLLVTHGLLLWGGLLSSFLINIALLFLRPVASIASFVAGINSANTALGGLADDATPIQKIQAVFMDIGTAAVTVGGNIRTWAAGVGEDMAEAEGAMATAGAGITGVLNGMQRAMETLLSQSWLPWVAGAAALVGAYEGFQQLGSAARAAAAAVTSAVDSMTASGAVDNISSQIGNLNTQIKQVPGAAADAKNSVSGLAQGYAAAGSPVNALADATAHFILNLVSGQRSINAYESAISNLTSQQKTLFQVAGTTMQQNGISFVQALGLMDAAGIKAGESFQEDMTQIDGLIKGYQDLGVQGGLLGNSINAITLSTEQQESEISKITQAWTSFISLLTGGESAFSTFGQQILSIGQSLGSTATTLETSNGKASVSIKGVGGDLSSLATAAKTSKTSVDGLSSASLNLKSALISGISDASNQLNSLMELSSAAGAGSQGLNEITQAGKDMVSEMLPVAKGSQDATTMLYGLAQQAGYTGSGSFQSLAQWAGKVQNPMQQLENITNKMTVAAGNLAADVQNLANAIDTDLNSAMSEAVLNANGTQKAFNNMATAVKTSHGDISDMIPAAQSLATTLLDDLGGNATQAKSEFITFEEAMGLTKTQADLLWASVNKLATAIDGLHSKTITITANEITTGSLGSAGIESSALPAVKSATGMLVPGTGNGDTVPAMLTPGEAVVPKHLVSAVAPILAAGRVPGFASGGLIAPMTAPIADPTGLSALQTQIGITTSNAAMWTSQADKASVAAATAAAALASAKATLADKAMTEDQQKYNTAAASAAAMTKMLAAAEKADTAAWTHVKTAEAMKSGKARDAAIDAAYKIYDADSAAVTKDKAKLKTLDATMAAADKALAGAKNTEAQDKFTLWQKQTALTNLQAQAAQSDLDTARATQQLDALEKIQSGSAGASSMNSLLLPGTPLASLASAMPGVGLSWGSYDQGGFLPPGLSLAVNGTGAPEPVGAAAGPGELHSHINVNLDGQQIWGAVQKQGLVYGLRNNGVSTGLMKPR